MRRMLHNPGKNILTYKGKLWVRVHIGGKEFRFSGFTGMQMAVDFRDKILTELAWQRFFPERNRKVSELNGVPVFALKYHPSQTSEEDLQWKQARRKLEEVRQLINRLDQLTEGM